MNVEVLVKSHYITKTDCIFPAYDVSFAKTVKLQKGKKVKVVKIEFDEIDNMIIVMCVVDEFRVNFQTTLAQLNNNFSIDYEYYGISKENEA